MPIPKRTRLWQRVLPGVGLTQSMSRQSNCLDNAAMEGFFSHLKEEWFRIQQPATLNEFHAGMTEHLCWWKRPGS